MLPKKKTGWVTGTRPSGRNNLKEPQDRPKGGEEIDFVPGVWGEAAKLFDSWRELQGLQWGEGFFLLVVFFSLFFPFSPPFIFISPLSFDFLIF